MTDEPPRPPWQMDWTKQAQHDFQNMPAEASDLVMSARAELIRAEDPYFRGIDADASLPHWMTVRPLASTSPGGRSSSPKPSGPDRWAARGVCTTGGFHFLSPSPAHNLRLMTIRRRARSVPF